MSEILVVVGGLLWFAYAGIGMGFLIERPLAGPVRRTLCAMRANDGLKADPSEEEILLWTRRWGRVLGFVSFFGALGVFSVVAPEVGSKTIGLVLLGVVVPAIGYAQWWSTWWGRTSKRREAAGG